MLSKTSKAKKPDPKDKIIQEQKNVIAGLEMAIGELSEKFDVLGADYIYDMKKMLLKLGGAVYIDTVISVAAKDPNLVINIEIDKGGGAIYQLVKTKGDDEK